MPHPRNAVDAASASTPGEGAFVAHAQRIAALTLVSRALGLARDALCARLFGAGAVWSSFALAFLLPNLFRRLFGEGALSAAFIPSYAALWRQDPQAGRRFAAAAFAVTLTGLAAATIAGELILWLLLTATPLGQSGGLALKLAMALLPFMPLICATAVLGGALQTHSVFAPAAAAPVVLNLCIIAAAALSAFGLGLEPERGIFLVAFSVLLAGIVQLSWALAALWRRNGAAFDGQTIASSVQPLQQLARAALPAVVGLGALQLNTLLDGLIASYPVLGGSTVPAPFIGPVPYPLDEASNAVLFYANRLQQFPLGLIGVSLATAVFPALAKLSHEQDAFARTLRRSIRLAVFLGAPAAAGLAVVRTPLAATIYAGGRFDLEAQRRVALALLGYCPAVFAAIVSQSLSRAYFARGDLRTPMQLAVAAVGLNLTLNLLLIWPLREAGLAWASSASAAAQAAALLALCRRRIGAQPWDAAALRACAHTLVGASLCAAAAMGAMRLTAARLDAARWSSQALTLAAAVGAGAGAYLAWARLIGADELRWLVEALTRRGAAPQASAPQESQ